MLATGHAGWGFLGVNFQRHIISRHCSGVWFGIRQLPKQPSHQLSAQSRVIIRSASFFGGQSTRKISELFQDTQPSPFFLAVVEFQTSASAACKFWFEDSWLFSISINRIWQSSDSKRFSSRFFDCMQMVSFQRAGGRKAGMTFFGVSGQKETLQVAHN